jgi:hypothetical protein
MWNRAEACGWAATAPGLDARASEPRCNDSKEVGGVGRGGGTRYRSLFSVAKTPMRFFYGLWNRAEPCGWAATAPGLDARASEPRCNDSKEVGGVGRGGGTRYRSLFPVAKTPMRFFYGLWNRAEPCGWAATAPGLDARASEPGCNDSKEVGGVGRGGGTRFRSLFSVAKTPMRFFYGLWNRAEPRPNPFPVLEMYKT